ncbi:hypothetical protein ACP275_03G014500 [Erythranthe tilingii]
MSTASVGLAEAYMIRKVYKEKMNKMDNVSKKPMIMKSSHEKAEEKSCRRSASASGGGCFSLSMFKKIHPNTVLS